MKGGVQAPQKSSEGQRGGACRTEDIGRQGRRKEPHFILSTFEKPLCRAQRASAVCGTSCSGQRLGYCGGVSRGPTACSAAFPGSPMGTPGRLGLESCPGPCALLGSEVRLSGGWDHWARVGWREGSLHLGGGCGWGCIFSRRGAWGAWGWRSSWCRVLWEPRHQATEGALLDLRGDSGPIVGPSMALQRPGQTGLAFCLAAVGVTTHRSVEAASVSWALGAGPGRTGVRYGKGIGFTLRALSWGVGLAVRVTWLPLPGLEQSDRAASVLGRPG